MKKHILKFSLALAVLVAAGYTVYSSQTSSKVSGIALSNVEALASGESGSGIWRVTVYSGTRWRCDKGGTRCCPTIDC